MNSKIWSKRANPYSSTTTLKTRHPRSTTKHLFTRTLPESLFNLPKFMSNYESSSSKLRNSTTKHKNFFIFKKSTVNFRILKLILIYYSGSVLNTHQLGSSVPSLWIILRLRYLINFNKT